MDEVKVKRKTAATAKPKIKNIHEAIIHVKGRVQYILRDQRVSFGKGSGYTVATEASYIAAVRPHEVQAGIYGYCLDIEPVRTAVTEVKTQYGSKSVIHHVCKYTYRMVHAPSGTSIDCVSMGESIGSDDKGLNKASTISAKYATMKVLYRLETGDDPDKYAGTFDDLVGEGGQEPEAQPVKKTDQELVDDLLSQCKVKLRGRKAPKIYEVLGKEPQKNQYGYTVDDWHKYMVFLSSPSFEKIGGNNVV